MAEQFDVVIVGARVGGSPLATLLARSGVKVAVLEQAQFPAPTLSSHVIESDGLAFLARLGLLDRIRDTKAPFIPGMEWSRTTRSNSESTKIWSPLSPLLAAATWNPSASSIILRTSRPISSSSMHSILPERM